MSVDYLKESLDLKEEGSVAWGEGKYNDSIEKFTAAIDTILDHSTDISAKDRKDNLKVLYSNRSAAYLKVNNANAAFEDGRKCCDIDSEWSKGYVRKGDALYALLKYTECYNAYNSALRIAPNDASIQAKCELAQRAIRNESSSSTSQPSNSSTILPGTFPSRTSSNLTYLVMLAKASVLIHSILIYLPILGTAYAFRAMLISAIISYTIALFLSHGRPSTDSAYLERILSDPSSVSLFMVVLQFISRPQLFAIAAVVLAETVLLAQFAVVKAQAMYPSLLTASVPLVDRFFPFLLASADASLWPRASASQRWSIVTARTAYAIAVCEVVQLFSLLIALMLPSRSIMLLYLWGQYLRMRFMVDRSGNLSRVMGNVDSRICAILDSSTLIPAVIRQGYALLKEILKKQIEPPAPGSAPTGGLSSMMNSCSVM